MSTPVAQAGDDPASTDFRFISAVAAFGMLLRQSKFKGQADYEWVQETASAAMGDDEGGYRSEFLGLVKKASKLA